jgi:hypothetical protein
MDAEASKTDERSGRRNADCGRNMRTVNDLVAD